MCPGSGFIVTWNHSPLIGFTDDETVMLDFDDTHFRDVRYWARRVAHFFDLGGFLILKSSENNYHVVFNRRVDWSENMSIVAWVSLYSDSDSMRKWFLMQCIKGASTLRVGPKGKKHSPRIVYREGKQDVQIEGFLMTRKLMKKIMRMSVKNL